MADDVTDVQGASPKSTGEEDLALIASLIGPYLEQQHEGFRRVDRLVRIAEQIGKPALRVAFGDDPDEEDASPQDVLRAAVVLTHAHLEEFLRTMARVLLPHAGEACLNEIPLVGLGGRKEKFWLGKLVHHKGKLVDDLLKESVSEYLERSTYNDTEEIANLLRSLGFNVADHSQEFPVIQEMIERRHQIVHRADRFEVADSAVLKTITPSEVSRWLAATQQFMEGFHIRLLERLMRLQSAKS